VDRNVDTIWSLFPKAEDLLATAPDELGPLLLRIAFARRESGDNLVSLEVAKHGLSFGVPDGNKNVYHFAHKSAVETLLSGSWDWLRSNGLITSAPGRNGQQGWMVVTKTGEEALSAPQNLQRLREALAFPKALLHPVIAENVWAALRRGDLSGAVFTAFKAVEEAVRAAGGFAATDLGVNLMRRAFEPNAGPLADLSQAFAERDARAHLFAGAIGCYKNPNSHRTDAMELREAQEQAMLASHLLRIVDARRAAKRA
jgi:uncharacterized protein (TIGR02391 family)